jgi:hypothetical protein
VPEAVAAGPVEYALASRTVRQTDLVPLVEECWAGQGEQEQSGRSRVLGAEARDEPAEVVVREHPGGATPGCRGLDRPSEHPGVPLRVQQLERERRIKVLQVRLPFRAREVDLAHEQGVAHGLADPSQGLAGVRRVARVGGRELPFVRAQRQSERLGRGRVVAQLRVLQEAVDRVHAVARDIAGDPEAQRSLHRRHDLGIAPVEVGLLRIERMQVVAAVKPTPGRTSERGGPVVRRVGPDVPVRMLAEPRVLDRGMAGHQVEEHAQAALACARHEAVEVRQRAEDRVNVLVVGHVVAEVVHRRRVDRRKPEGIDAQPREMVEALLDPPQVAYAIAIRVLERARIDLVDDGVLPPHEQARLAGCRGEPGLLMAGTKEGPSKT